MDNTVEWIPNEIYTECMKHLPIFCIDILVFNKSKTKILLAKRYNEPLKDVFFVTGGRLLKNEEILDGVVRQAKRELGLTLPKSEIIFGGLTGEIFPNSAFSEDTGYHAITAYYGYITDNSLVVTLDSQHTEWKWFDVSDLSIHPNVKERIKNILQKI